MSSIPVSQPATQLHAVPQAEAAVGDSHIHSLTGLRWWAALVVFFSHLYHFQYFGIQNPALLAVFGTFGHLGVSIFYVLSGFVLYINYASRVPDLPLRDFYVARFARVYPVYLVTTLLAIPIEFFSSFKPYLLQNLGLNVGLLQCLGPAACGRLNDVGWSVGIEAFFYLFFPVLFAQFNSRGKILLLLGTLLALFVTLQCGFPDTFYSSPRFPANRLLEFTAGLCIANQFYRNQIRMPVLLQNNKTISALVIGLLCALLLLQPLFLPAVLQRYDYLAYIPCAGLLILLIACLEKQGCRFWVFTGTWILLGGEISYSFYLIHNLILRYLEHGFKIAFHIPVETLQVPIQLGLAGGALLLSVVTSVLLYNNIEKPWRQHIRAWNKFNPKTRA